MAAAQYRSDLSVCCLEGLEIIERRCEQLGLSMYVVNPSEMPKSQSAVVENSCFPKEYEVAAIIDYKVEDGCGWYLVHWKGWDSTYDSWEPKENLLHCRALLQRYHKQCSPSLNKRKRRVLDVDKQANSLKKLKRLCETKSNDPKRKRLQFEQTKVKEKSPIVHSPETLSKIAGDFIMKTATVRRLKEWESHINQNLPQNEAPISVINEVDFEGPPENFTFINEYKPGEGIEIPDDPLVGCECESDCFENKDSCCSSLSGGQFAYTKKKKLRIPQGSPIYECNFRCKCGADCPNRVVQHGRKVKLAIFRTSNGCGWGVKTLEQLKKDSFVMEYVGEVITSEEAEKRGKVYDAEGRTYLFDLDYNDGDCPYTVDAAHYGNISHFMNHSCEPNLVVYGVWINTLDPQLPRIAFFAKRDIDEGEELTFDYMMSGEAKTRATNGYLPNQGLKRMPCKCGSKQCRQFLF